MVDGRRVTNWTDRDEVPVEGAADRPYYSAVAVSPDGTDAYLVYNAFTTPLQERHHVGSWTRRGGPARGCDRHRGAGDVHRGPSRRVTGDPRASAQNNVVIEFLGDYVYADATNDYGVAVWNDMREGSTCDPVNTWRAEVQEAGPPLDASGRPEIQQVCPATFGNSDIWAWSGADLP